MNEIKISDIKINEGRREVNSDTVRQLAGSIEEIGLLNPITLTKDNTLVSGLHRVEAFKFLGLPKIPFTRIDDSSPIKSQLAEIDENLIREDLDSLQRGELLIQRKRIYEELHPESKAGKKRAAGMNKKLGHNVSETVAPTFVEDTAAKTGLSKRTIQQDVQLVENLDESAKQQIKLHRIGKRAALELARLPKDQQKGALHKLIINKYTKNPRERRERKKKQKSKLGKAQPSWIDIEREEKIKSIKIIDGKGSIEFERAFGSFSFAIGQEAKLNWVETPLEIVLSKIRILYDQATVSRDVKAIGE